MAASTPKEIKFIILQDVLRDILGTVPDVNPLPRPVALTQPNSVGPKGLLVRLKRGGRSSDPDVLSVGSLYFSEAKKYETRFNRPDGSNWMPDIQADKKIGLTERLDYDRTSEFELAFFPQAQILSLLNYPDANGLLITRGLVSFPNLKKKTGSNKKFYKLGNYRTLIARPNPDPVKPEQVLSQSNVTAFEVREDQALSLVIAPPCPPVWRTSPPPAGVSTRSIDDGPVSNSLTTMENLDPLEGLYYAAKEAGYPITWGPTYRVNPFVKLLISLAEFFNDIFRPVGRIFYKKG